jgi:hypothetical protein
MKSLKNLLDRQHSLVIVLFALFSCAAYYFTSEHLTHMYETTAFSVPYFEAQTSFDADKLKGWYAELVERETFGRYIQTQLFDYVFMVAVLAMGLFVGYGVSRLFPYQSWFRVNGFWLALGLPLAAVSDAFENLVSFIMLWNPETFANYWAIVYSSFAAIKFGLWGVAIVVLGIQILAIPIEWFRWRNNSSMMMDIP